MGGQTVTSKLWAKVQANLPRPLRPALPARRPAASQVGAAPRLSLDDQWAAIRATLAEAAHFADMVRRHQAGADTELDAADYELMSLRRDLAAVIPALRLATPAGTLHRLESTTRPRRAQTAAASLAA
jgi:hypothetical protein